jgi:hypothetical protein
LHAAEPAALGDAPADSLGAGSLAGAAELGAAEPPPPPPEHAVTRATIARNAGTGA